MSDADYSSFPGFGKLVPGFDFLQNLAKQAAGSATQSIPQMPNLGSWIAPTLNLEELDKRIEELKAVQFWLDQNAMALKATIQALEVQKMTLATLKGMNFSMGDVANAFRLKVADSVAEGVQKAADKAKNFSGLEVPETSYQKRPAKPAVPVQADAADEGQGSQSKPGPEGSPAAPAAGVVDPMQWWGALTQQFQNIATAALKDVAKKAAMDPAKGMATGLAKDALQSATEMARGMADSASKTVASGARKAMSSALRSAQPWPVPGQAAASAPAKKTKKPAGAAKTSPAARKGAARTR